MEVDSYGVPLNAFGNEVPLEFFETLGRILAVNSKMEYLHERLNHLPDSETAGVKKVVQFRSRFTSGRDDRNAVVHSYWAFGAHATDPNVMIGVRYKIRKRTVGHIAAVSLRGIPGNEKAQETVLHTLDSLRALLKRDVVTMLIGERAYAEVMLARSSEQLLEDGVTSTLS